MMRVMMGWVAMMAMLATADSDPDEGRPQVEARGQDRFDVRVSGGVGVSNYAVARGARFLAGKAGGDLLYGLQVVDLREIRFLATDDGIREPVRSLLSFQALVGWNTSPPGTVSSLLISGVGVSIEQGGKQRAAGVDDVGAEVASRTFHPSLLLGVDLCFSSKHNAGLSVQAGGIVSNGAAGFAMLQLDVGAW